MQAVRKLTSCPGKAFKHAYLPKAGEGEGVVRRPPVTYELIPNYTLQGIFQGYASNPILC